jgi:cation:H+ antiporter
MLGAAITFFSSLTLTNSIEYLEHKTRLGASFIGSIITPLFTSIPEIIIFTIAIIIYSGDVGNQIGIGTLFGQPFMTSTLSYGLVGISALLGLFYKHRTDTNMHVQKNLLIPYVFVSILFPLLVIPGLTNSMTTQYVLAAIFASSYFIFTWIVYRGRERNSSQIESKPYLSRITSPVKATIIQLFFVAISLYYGANIMVASLASLSSTLNVNPLGLSIFIIPFSTSIPETMSSMIWAFKGRDTLSISSLVGEKVLYSTFYPAIGLAAVQWTSNLFADLSILFTTIVSFSLFLFIRNGRIPIYALFLGISFFLLYVTFIF